MVVGAEDGLGLAVIGVGGGSEGGNVVKLGGVREVYLCSLG